MQLSACNNVCISCDVNLKDQLGLTPLHLAVQRNHLPVVSVLLEHGATDHLKDSKGKTALYYAIQMVSVPVPIDTVRKLHHL